MVIKLEENLEYDQESQWFTYNLCSKTIFLPQNLPDIDEILFSISEVELQSVNIIDTFCGQSYEGQILTGKCAELNFYLKNKILFSSKENMTSIKTLHIYESSFIQSASIVIPCQIGGMIGQYLFQGETFPAKISITSENIRKEDERIYQIELSLFTAIFFR